MSFSFPSKNQFILINLKVLDGIGKFNGACKTLVSCQVNLLIRPPNTIPCSLKSKLELQLKELEN